MYKISYTKEAMKSITDNKINKTKLNSLIHLDIKEGNPSSGGDIIFLVVLDGKDIALIGSKAKNKIRIAQISTSPIIVGK